MVNSCFFSVYIISTGVLLITLLIPKECQSQICKNDEVPCGPLSRDCYLKSAECDGIKDCENGYDELPEICEERKCNTTEFHCANGDCIPIFLNCNSRKDCLDGSDEADCEIKNTKKCPNEWQVLCLSGECIRKDQICDGLKDCVDNSDETYTKCSNSRCPAFSFQCNYGACINAEAVCNGVSDCVDSSDELLPECKTKINVTDEMICGKNTFKCNSGLCIKKQKLCDGIRDCDDGSDETYRQCRTANCGSISRCGYGACGGLHCVDGSSLDTDNQVMFSTFGPDSRDEETNQTTKDFETTIRTIPKEPPDEQKWPPRTTPSRPINPPTYFPPPKTCIFPNQPSNGVVTTNTGTIPKPFEFAPAWTILIYACNEGYSLGTAPSVIVCMNDQWTNPFPNCLKTCPPLTSENHEIECLHEGRPVACDTACEGTIANIKCKEAFELTNFVYQPYNGIECNQRGNWSNQLFDCNPECGTLIPKAQALVVKGYTAAKGEFPWHAGIYRRESEKYEYYEQICGGTLISEKIVVSAAHCFWNWNDNKPKVNINKYAVAVGKFYRTWNSTKDKHAQYSEVQQIILPKRFRAEESTFANDIAVLLLNNTIKFTSRVRPVCIDWSNELYKSLLKPGALGTVAGWGLTEEFGSTSEELQAVRMPYVEYDTCISGLPEEFKPFITNDKICAGYNNGTSVCTGDSGGGLAFKKSNRYFIQGVVSVSPAKGSTCDSYRYVAFTSVPQHLDFITKVERSTSNNLQESKVILLVKMFSNVNVLYVFLGVYILILLNGINSQTSCKEDQFHCRGFDEECISKELTCDGKLDCSNGNDETFETCEFKVCNETQFHCAYGGCIPLSSKCDTSFDCADNSDEADCEMKPTSQCPKKWQVFCLSGECIRQDQICDGVKDCIDNSDETYSTCFNFRCPSDSFKCNYGACIDSEAVCNGIADCVDHSDELLPKCKNGLNITSDLICGENNFKCGTGLCIKKEKLCDGIRDCDDGSDETYRQCANKTCPDTFHQCAYGACTTRFSCVADNLPPAGLFSGPSNSQSFGDIDKIQFIPLSPGADPVLLSPPKPQCYFPGQPENGVAMTNTGMIPKPYESAPAWTILIYTCNEGYSLGTAPSVVVCMNDRWTVDPFPICLKTCPSLVSQNHEIECKHDGKVIPCEQACDGTVANIKCKEAFEIQNFIYQPYNGIQCNTSGNWSNDLFDCNPECGTLIPKAQALVIKGYTAAKGEFPWHAGIYRQDSSEDEYFEQICGGTLISERVIVSAAHCFWDFNDNKPNTNPEKYAVAVGKFYRTWNSTKDKYAQYSEIERIILPNKFRAEDSSFANDIAILILNNTIKFTTRVRPVCVDWGNELYKSLLKPGALGTVAGWGLTEEFGLAAEELQAVRMPYVEYDTCVSNLPDTFKSFITHDKICAGYNNGTSICTGDSGGGISFKKSNRYFIEGVVSVAPAKGTTCDSYQYVAFTSVSQHLDFIMEIERETH
ncbi:uncharacterized protein LOC123298642 [Chrysoperla carnea]|uniref:uncharacterized protein LOC123298642 n=1 Tax=Chrysoperla carnea TaxID=189513 RepID=UPI001D06BB7C|nr:uncharacterized protein LOC123298642 [Chrysoperla carnea]